MEPLLWIVAVLVVTAGLVGTVLPAVPGAMLVFAGLLLAAWIDDFEKVGKLPLMLIGGLALLSFLVDVLTTAVGARKAGASTWAVVGAGLGTVAGLFFGFPGVVFGPFLGAVLGEIAAGKNLPQASRAGVGTWIGVVLGVAAKLTLVFAMMGIFVLAYLY